MRETPRRRGYSLPEILIVLVILGLAIGVVTPAFFGMLERGQLRRHVTALETALRQAPFEARRARASIRLDPGYFRGRHAFPDDWAITVDPAINVRPNGVCSGGRVIITRSGEILRELVVTAPRCAVDDASA